MEKYKVLIAGRSEPQTPSGPAVLVDCVTTEEASRLSDTSGGVQV